MSVQTSDADLKAAQTPIKTFTVTSPAYATPLATDATAAPTGTTLIVQVGILTGDLMLSNPTGAVNRQKIEFIFTQDATGGRSLTLDTKFRFPSSSTLSSPINSSNGIGFTNANATSRLMVEYDAADDTFDLVAFVPGY